MKHGSRKPHNTARKEAAYLDFMAARAEMMKKGLPRPSIKSFERRYGLAENDLLHYRQNRNRFNFQPPDPAWA